MSKVLPGFYDKNLQENTGRIRKIYDTVTQMEPTEIVWFFEGTRKASEARRNGVWGHPKGAKNGRECIGPDEEVTHDYACLFYAFYMFYIF
jgi:hypothetical protein